MRKVASLVKLEHTIFALPFAYVGIVLALADPSVSPGVSEVAFVTLAMVGARTMAMALNRLIDQKIDAQNPRTAMRELPAGVLQRRTVWLVVALSLMLLLLCTLALHPITRVLWPLPVAGFVIYPLLKRFTWTCHFFLGVVIGLAPVGASLAVSGDAPGSVLLIWLAVACWIAGFDLIYATQDVDFDRSAGIKSLPATFGIPVALGAARVLHLVTIVAMVLAGVVTNAGPIWFITCGAIAGLLAWENSIVKPNDLSKVDAAFFTTNGFVAVLFFMGALADHVA